MIRPILDKIALLSLLSITIPALAQDVYVKTDTSLLIGMEMVVRTPSHNSRYIETTFKGVTTTFAPDQIVEYRTRYDKVYESRQVDISGETKQVFLERLANGPYKLFYYRQKGLTTYFLTDSSTAELKPVELERGNYREELASHLTKNEWISDHLRIAKYRRNSLAKLVSFYNDGKERPFPYAKFGVSAGSGITKMTVSSKFGFALRASPISLATEIVRTTPIPADLSLSLGVFGDIPILLSNLSLNVGIYYTKNNYLVVLESTNFLREIEIDLATIQVPILLRHTFPKAQIRPFINGGIVFSKNTSNTNAVYQTVLTVNSPQRINITRESYIDDSQFGLICGGGLQKTIDHRKTVSLELRLGKFFGNDRSLGKSQANLMLGFTI